MVSSKRQRGKQRKAAKSRVGGGADSTDATIFSPPKEIVALVRRGSSIGTASIISDMKSFIGSDDGDGWFL